MKQEQNIETKAQSQNRKGIEDAESGNHQPKNRLYTQLVINPITPSAKGRGQEGGLRLRFGREGPPGRARSPGTKQTQFPDHPPDGNPDRVLNYQLSIFNYQCITMNINILLINKKQIFFNNQFFNYLNFLS
jgi:hypothetical protein